MGTPGIGCLFFLFLASISKSQDIPQCGDKVKYPWMCLTVTADELYRNLTPPSAHQVFTVLICSGPQCNNSLADGPLALRHQIIDRLVLFHANMNRSVPITLPPRWLSDIRLHEVHIADTLLSSDFLSGNPFAEQAAFLSKLTLSQCQLKGMLRGMLTQEAPARAQYDTGVMANPNKVANSSKTRESSIEEPQPAFVTELEQVLGNTTTETQPRQYENVEREAPDNNLFKHKQHYASNSLPLQPSSIPKHNNDLAMNAKEPAMVEDSQEFKTSWADGSTAKAHNSTGEPAVFTSHLGELKLLWHLDLSRNEITGLAQNAFPNGLTKLRSVDLSKNYISQIEKGSFVSLVSLTSLSLSYNKLQSMNREMFSDPEMKLEKLDIR